MSRARKAFLVWWATMIALITVKMALADRIDRRLITRLKVSAAQVCLDHRHDRSLNRIMTL